MGMELGRPHDSTHYPFFTKAHQNWSAHQCDEAVYVQALKDAGFGEVIVQRHDYTVEMPAQQWYDMVRGRFWSNLAQFTEKEIDDGIKEIKERVGNTSQISFPDRILFIVAKKMD